jgi:hypothetical protein
MPKTNETDVVAPVEKRREDVQEGRRKGRCFSRRAGSG